ncbi:rolling circle replication-associated protein [Aeoliella mucimassa]|uniref:Replication-associated protein ORF2/G2P domain-containing protein n=1 Tax=Aeoliella mucimassa TaxID=2527972 RepID=A0A518AUD3_9BACT|nr:hypothetical protein [Aeoliella mucimassa]QDU58326.1 hypothetical protein Pan181_45600 [Aeoliella mucimassa]
MNEKPNGFHVIGCGCKSFFCPECCTGRGWALRHKLMAAVQRWQASRPIMVTCTVDPRNFDGPEQAFDYVREKGLISRMVRELRRLYGEEVGHYFAVLELHESGWPHWHVLIDADFIPHDSVERAWNAAGPAREGHRFRMGMVKITKPRGFVSKDHAANYSTKYLVKFPKGGYPDWVLKRQGIFKRYTASQGLFSDPELDALRDAAERAEFIRQEGYPPEWEMDEEPDEYEMYVAYEYPDGEAEAPARGPYERRAESIEGRVKLCGRKVTIIEYKTTIEVGGEVVVNKRWVASGNESLSALADLAGHEISSNRIILNWEQCEAIVHYLEGRGGQVSEWAPRKEAIPPPLDCQRALFDTGPMVLEGVGV